MPRKYSRRVRYANFGINEFAFFHVSFFNCNQFFMNKLILLLFVILAGCGGSNANVDVYKIGRSITGDWLAQCESHSEESSLYYQCQRFGLDMGLCSTSTQQAMNALAGAGVVNTCPRLMASINYQMQIWRAYESGELTITQAKLESAKADSQLLNSAPPATINQSTIANPFAAPAASGLNSPYNNGSFKQEYETQQAIECARSGKLYNGQRCVP